MAVCGSLQAASGNQRLLERARELAPRGAVVEAFDDLGRLPHFNPDLLATIEPSVAAWRNAIAQSDALLIACPEYGHSLPGALKNAIDWVIGSAELEGKVVGTTASTPHASRGLLGLQALHTTLAAVSAQVVGGAPIVRGPEADQQIRALLDALLLKVHQQRSRA